MLKDCCVRPTMDGARAPSNAPENTSKQAGEQALTFQLLVVREVGVKFFVQNDGRLVGPAPCHIPYRVPTAAQNHCWFPKGLDEFDSISMAIRGQVEFAEPVTPKRVCATLQDDYSLATSPWD